MVLPPAPATCYEGQFNEDALVIVDPEGRDLGQHELVLVHGAEVGGSGGWQIV